MLYNRTRRTEWLNATNLQNYSPSYTQFFSISKNINSQFPFIWIKNRHGNVTKFNSSGFKQ